MEEIAKSTGFQKRKSKFTPQMFFDISTFNISNRSNVSLDDHCCELKDKYGIEIKKQSLDERFSPEAVCFIKHLLEEQLSRQTSSALDFTSLQQFTSVKIKDSTRFQISSHLKEHYPGNTGSASGAGVHVQFEFDLVTGRITDLNVTDALRQDQTDAKETISEIETGSLILRDLGYHSLEVCKEIQERNAYFITRHKPKTKIYIKKNNRFKELELTAILRKLRLYKLPFVAIEAFVGEAVKLPVRMIIEAMPEDEIKKRITKAEREAHKKGRKVSKEYKTHTALNIFITNIPESWFAAEKIRSLYRLRWQIELRFKTWKSICQIHKCKKMSKERFECYLFANLLYIIINWEIAINFFSIIWREKQRALSFMKFYKTTLQRMDTLRKVIIEQGGRLEEFLINLFETSIQYHLLERKKDELGLAQILGIDISKN